MKEYSRTRIFLTLGAVIFAIVATVWLWWMVFGEKAHLRREAAEAGAGRVVAEGQANAGRDAVEVIEGAGERTDATRDRIEEGTDAIRNAPPADRGRTTLRELCRDAAYSQSPRCVVR